MRARVMHVGLCVFVDVICVDVSSVGLCVHARSPRLSDTLHVCSHDLSECRVSPAGHTECRVGWWFLTLLFVTAALPRYKGHLTMENDYLFDHSGLAGAPCSGRGGRRRWGEWRP